MYIKHPFVESSGKFLNARGLHVIWLIGTTYLKLIIIKYIPAWFMFMRPWRIQDHIQGKLNPLFQENVMKLNFLLSFLKVG